MVLLVDGQVLDVGFGGATPIGPVPLDGEATYGAWTWRTERTVTPEGEDAWLVRLFDTPLYTFTEVPRHPVDYLAPNHYSSTHPLSLFTQHVIAQRWDGRRAGRPGRQTLSERRADGRVTELRLSPPTSATRCATGSARADPTRGGAGVGWPRRAPTRRSGWPRAAIALPQSPSA